MTGGKPRYSLGVEVDFALDSAGLPKSVTRLQRSKRTSGRTNISDYCSTLERWQMQENTIEFEH